MTYEVIVQESGSILKRVNDDGSESWIPMVEGNSDYQTYLDTLASELANDPAGNK